MSVESVTASVATASVTQDATPLFGGAMATSMPGDWLDASDARPVPDHQEVWLERSGAERSLIIEVLERVDAEDSQCGAFHFSQLVEDAMGVRILGLKGLPAAAMHESTRAAGPGFAVHGQYMPRTKTGAHGKWVHVRLAVLRLVAQATDLLVSVSRPEATALAQGVAAADAADAELLGAVVGSLEVRDWGLFSPGGAGAAETEG